MTINAEGEHPWSIKQIRVVHCKMAIARSSWSGLVEKNDQKVQFFTNHSFRQQFQMQMVMHQFVPGVSTDMICINSALIKTKSKNMSKIITDIKMFFSKG